MHHILHGFTTLSFKNLNLNFQEVERNEEKTKKKLDN